MRQKAKPKPKAISTLWEIPTKCGHMCHMMIEKSEALQVPSQEILDWYAKRDCIACREHDLSKIIMRREG